MRDAVDQHGVFYERDGIVQTIGAYLIGVTAAALLYSLVCRLGSGKLVTSVIRMVCGVFMALAVIAPWAKLEWRMPSKLDGFQAEAEELAAQGEKTAREAMAQIINQKLRTYILDKAGSLGLELEVEIVLSQEDVPTPVAVTLRGAVSPYHKEILGDYLLRELGISKEAQRWIA